MPKRIQPLTAKGLAAVRPRDGEVIELGDGAVAGLRVRITKGGRFWSLNIRNPQGERRRFDVGDNLSLAEARRRAERLKQAIKEGADPTAERREARRRVKNARAGIGTFGSLVDAYFGEGDGESLRTKDEQRARIRHVFGKHLDRPAIDITAPELQVVADAHPSASSAGRAIAYLKPLARWASKRGLMQKGFHELEKPVERNTKDGGHAVLDRETLVKVLPALEGHHGSAARMLLWTAARLDEVCSATWNEFDLSAGTWTITAGRRKDTRNRARKKQAPAQPHAIPLPRQAISMLTEMRDRTECALVFPNARGGKLDNWDRWSKIVFEGTGTSGWTRHDLRRTCATLAAELGAAPHIVSVLLGHKNPENNQLLGIYNKSRYTQQHAEALQRVAELLTTWRRSKTAKTTFLYCAGPLEHQERRSDAGRDPCWQGADRKGTQATGSAGLFRRRTRNTVDPAGRVRATAKCKG
jgi:integrase